MRLAYQDDGSVGVLGDVRFLHRLETGRIELDSDRFLVLLETFSRGSTHLVRGPWRVPDDIDVGILDPGYLLDQFLDLVTKVGTGRAAHGCKSHTDLYCIIVDSYAVN